MILISPVLYSCTLAYIPNAVNTPLLSDKGDLKSAIRCGSSGLDLQFAGAVTNHIGLMLNGNFATMPDLDEESDGFMNVNNVYSDYAPGATGSGEQHFFGEFGVGCFTRVGLIARLEAFAGVGYGSFQVGDFSFDSGLDNHIDANGYRFFVQPTAGLSTASFDISLTARFVKLNFLRHSPVYPNLSGSFVDPVLTFKAGKGNTRFVAQVGYSVPIQSDIIQFEYRPLLISVGLEVTDSFDNVFRIFRKNGK
ncbi:MAG TPA: hypothetical protein VI413_01455 [Paludibacter sp.]